MKKITYIVFIALILPVVFSAEEPAPEVSADIYGVELDKVLEEGIFEGIEDTRLQGDGGFAPDDFFYFLDNFWESLFVGKNPENALKYKEEKVLELRRMIESGNKEAAKQILDKIENYNGIIQKEVHPEMEQRVRESSKSVKELLESLDDDLEGEEWEGIRDEIGETMKQEDRIALAAKVSKKIKELCVLLSELDTLEYSKSCKTSDDDPEWKKDMDKKLTDEQKKEAEEFFNIMSACFQNPKECRCNDLSTQQFAEQCNIMAPLAAECKEGKVESCDRMEELDDPMDLLPDYLQAAMEKVEEKYGGSKHDLYVPKDCANEGALTREACAEVMFRLNAPPECVEEKEKRKMKIQNENQARKFCEEVMFDLGAPDECKKAGLKDDMECKRHMFKLDAPEECLAAGLIGTGNDDWKKCEVIRFKLDAPEECLDAGLDGTEKDDWKKCESIRFKHDAPKECIDAGIDGSGRDDWKKCDAIRFRLEAAKECLDAGLDGTGRDDWKKCNAIQFKHDAPKECIDAGIDGSGRDDWKKCDEIRRENENKGARKEDCKGNELHICEDEFCKCVPGDEIGGQPNEVKKGAKRKDCRENELHVCEDGYCRCISKEDHQEERAGDDRDSGEGERNQPGDSQGGGDRSSGSGDGSDQGGSSGSGDSSSGSGDSGSSDKGSGSGGDSGSSTDSGSAEGT